MVLQAKEHFHNGIVVPRGQVDAYIDEDDVILIGPGMVRSEASEISKFEIRNSNLRELENIKDEGMQTAVLTNYLLQKHPHKQWVIDAGALQMMDVSLIPKNAILTPHKQEFLRLTGAHENFGATSVSLPNKHDSASQAARRSQSEVSQNFVSASTVSDFAQRHSCITLLKGEKDIVSNGEETFEIAGGNVGMTKGGTGDVLAGLVAALACKNEPLLAACAGSLINKAAGDDVYTEMGTFFNASDLANQIPRTMKRLLL